jgi:hypothetical protein
MLAGELLNSLIRKKSHTREPIIKNEKPGETRLSRDQMGMKLLHSSKEWLHHEFYALGQRQIVPLFGKFVYYALAKSPSTLTWLGNGSLSNESSRPCQHIVATNLAQ